MNLEEIFQSATKAVHLAHESYHKILKENSGIDVRLTWLTKEEFSAFASKRNGDGNFEISISEGVISFLFSAAEASFKSPNNKLVENAIQDIDGLSDMKSLPIEDEDYYIERFVKITILWIYFHELAHIAQDHNKIGSEIGCAVTGWDIPLEQVFVSSDGEDDSADGSLRHIFELSADSEATTHVIYFLSTTNMTKTVLKSDIWFLILGVTRLFASFYRGEFGKRKRVASGTHPSADLRLRLIIMKTMIICNDLQVTDQLVPWAQDRKSVFNVVKPAFISATADLLYLYNTLDENEFLQLVFSFDNGLDTYANTIFSRYTEIHPILIKSYKGLSTEGILKIGTAYMLG
ncbi:MAG: hypothetical protein ABF719_09645 [Acetobacter sp.]|uniref:hypothetical protein n=1 Tax=Acetobacter sp. TaxID=440 RepID=UPI0039EC5063